MKNYFLIFLAAAFLSSCVAVKFPSEITVHLELPEEMHEEQIERLIDEIHLAAKGSKVRTRVNITSDKN